MKFRYLLVLTIVFIIIHFGESTFDQWIDVVLFFSIGLVLIVFDEEGD